MLWIGDGLRKNNGVRTTQAESDTERKTNGEMGDQFGALEDGTTNKSSGVGKWMVGVETSKVV